MSPAQKHSYLIKSPMFCLYSRFRNMRYYRLKGTEFYFRTFYYYNGKWGWYKRDLKSTALVKSNIMEVVACKNLPKDFLFDIHIIKKLT